MKKIVLLLIMLNLLQHFAFSTCTPVTIITQPQNQNDSIPGHAHFSVTVNVDAPFNYYWYVNGVVVDSTVNSASASNTYNTPPLTMADSNSTYYCIITNCAGANTVTSNTVHLVCIPVSIIIQPLSQTVLLGDTANFGVRVNGTPPFSYYWYEHYSYLNDGLVSTTLNTYSDTSFYTTFPVSYSDNGKSFFCVITNCGGGGVTGNGYQATTNYALITVNCTNCQLYDNSQPSQTVVVGNSAYFSVSLNCGNSIGNNTNITCNWYCNGIWVYTDPIGYSNYTTPPLTLNDNGNYYSCEISFCQSNILSTGSDYVYVTCTDYSINYVSGCNSYTSPSGNFTWTSSGYYTDHLTNYMGCDSAIYINLTLTTFDTSITQTGNTFMSNQNGVTYQWLDCNNGNTSITNATNQSYTATANGDYAVLVSLNGCADTSACVLITTVGVSQLSMGNRVTISPNPFTNETTITFSEEQKNTTIKITDVIGKEIKTFILNGARNFILEKGEMNAGIYFVQITDVNKNVVNKKVVVQ